MIKWLARVRAGCLASRARLVGHGLEQGLPQCLCCGAEAEDDEHLLTGCPATGSQDWPALVAEAWAVAAKAVGVGVPMPPVSTMAQSHIMLLGALLPARVAVDWGLPPVLAPRFLAAFHRALALAVAELLRRREHLLAALKAPEGGHEPARAGQPALVMRCFPPIERQMSVGDLQEVEQRRQLVTEHDVFWEDVASSRAPVMGSPAVGGSDNGW